MGIDIYFADKGLRECKYALCAEHRRTPIEVVCNDTDQDIPYWQFRRIRRTDYRHEDIALPPEQPLFAYEYIMRKVGEEHPQDLPEEMADGLKTLIIQQNTRPVLEKEFLRWVEQQEFGKLVQWCVNQPDENKRLVEMSRLVSRRVLLIAYLAAVAAACTWVPWKWHLPSGAPGVIVARSLKFPPPSYAPIWSPPTQVIAGSIYLRAEVDLDRLLLELAAITGLFGTSFVATARR